ncbi:hypothetical protein BJ508DRAFT_127106 [Ascobolus immersus RN42]|uniref:Uncharacterized protein n=1 Tax=Ascobolus immersus RN42 TaxID=1160509 RepID=A0A3N4I7G8_ASCIM|nr:hypothetical protein BJ508DRAFT_127106 [Ascobolus immersus RN42]
MTASSETSASSPPGTFYTPALSPPIQLQAISCLPFGCDFPLNIKTLDALSLWCFVFQSNGISSRHSLQALTVLTTSEALYHLPPSEPTLIAAKVAGRIQDRIEQGLIVQTRPALVATTTTTTTTSSATTTTKETPTEETPSPEVLHPPTSTHFQRLLPPIVAAILPLFPLRKRAIQ